MALAGSPVLAKRLGPDTISKFEAAAARRLQEAACLDDRGLHVGAIYLYGYTAEAHMQAAYYRLIGYQARTEITADFRRTVIAFARKIGLMGRASHDVFGWARFLVLTRKQRSTGYSHRFEQELLENAKSIYARWRPALRYRVTAPTPNEISIVRDGARWFDRNHRALWR